MVRSGGASVERPICHRRCVNLVSIDSRTMLVIGILCDM
jgi:hypothetical protein